MLHKAFLLVFFLGILIFLFLNPSISVRAEGTTIKTNHASFYIPAEVPLKVYKFDPNPVEIEDIISKNVTGSDASFGIVVKNLSTGQEYNLNSKEVFSAASLYKLCVMYTIFKKGYQGELNLNHSDIQRNLKSMITVSSNEASYYLVSNYTSWKEITDNMHSIGLTSTTLKENPTLTSPKDMAKLLEMIAKGEAVNFDASYTMLKLLSEQRVNDRIPVYIPPETVVAHKTGELQDVRHDAGVLITPENNYILVLMSKGSASPESVKPIMAKISQDIHEFFRVQWANPPEIL